MSTSVRLLTPEDYDALRAIRLEALRLNPAFFAADPAQEEAFTKGQWLERLATASSFGGFVDGSLAALVVFSRPASRKLAHTGDLGAMYVRDSARGTGLADAMMEALLDHAAKEVEQIKLSVNAENVRAVKFYERHGFRVIGRIPRSLNIDGRFYDDLLMLRPVSSSD
jgi:ribosomal protein S18 acetylase RimI-like enzyme